MLLHREHTNVSGSDRLSQPLAGGGLHGPGVVESLGPVANLSKLWSLYAGDNKIKDLGPVKDLKWLSNLDVRGNEITDVAPISSLKELRWTFLHRNQISDISPLVAMTKTNDGPDRSFAPFWNLYLGKNPMDDEPQKAKLAELKEMGVRLNLDYVD